MLAIRSLCSIFLCGSLAFLVSVLILVELAWSLRELRKNKQNMVRVDSLPVYTEGGCEMNLVDNNDIKN
ncbi:hypothetical protein BGZ83_012102 [Gryganskiella cystojenkinii]|nr:hypothetical protein BGZ83_012102 [Gryganskiella cystojenkinii]